MFNKYLLRRNFKSTYSTEDCITYGHIAFKTRKADWVDTPLPSVVLISVHSSFHEGVNGHLKMDAFLSTIRKNVKGKVSILIAETAHLHTLRLTQLEDPLHHCLQSAKELTLRCRSYFEGNEVLYWSSSIMADKEYPAFKEQFEWLMRTNEAFQESLMADAEACYTQKRREEFPNKALFIEKMVDDLIEQCICMQILTRKGYRYLFYPGAPFASTEYVNRNFVSLENSLNWIDVFLTIEKKTKRP